MTEPHAAEPAPHAALQRRNIVVLAGVAALLIVGVILAVALPGLLHPTHRFQATIGLVSSTPGAITGEWDSCSGAKGYDDFQAGASTTMRDGNGIVVGSLNATNLNESTLAALAKDLRPGGLGSTSDEIIANVKKYQKVSCILYLSGDVGNADFYTLTFSDRGEFTYSRQELDAQGWYVELSLGD